MRTRTNIFLLLTACGVIGACSASEVCDEEPRLYQQARAGTHVQIPEGLDPLEPEREVPIPKASPNAPPPPGRCLDAPPTLRTGSSDS